MTMAEWLVIQDRKVAAHERQITAIRNLVKEGTRMMLETRKDLRAIAAAQKRTDLKLEALLDQMRQ
jgi:hypothetical protein